MVGNCRSHRFDNWLVRSIEVANSTQMRCWSRDGKRKNDGGADGIIRDDDVPFFIPSRRGTWASLASCVFRGAVHGVMASDWLLDHVSSILPSGRLGP